MTVYVDHLAEYGWKLRGRVTPSCHMMTDSIDLAELHLMAQRIGMERKWFQPRSSPHYDLTPTRRAKAVKMGAVELDIHKDSDRSKFLSILALHRVPSRPAPHAAGDGAATGDAAEASERK